MLNLRLRLLARLTLFALVSFGYCFTTPAYAQSMFAKLLVQTESSSAKSSTADTFSLWQVAALAPNKERQLYLRTQLPDEPHHAFLDAFWWTPVNPSSQDVFAKRPILSELNISGLCSEMPAAGKYASPFNPQVRAILSNTVAIIASSTRTSSLLLRCRLPRSTVLGYSDAARLAYINAKGVDPIDIRFASGDVEEEQITQEWITWRLAQMTSLVNNLTATYKAKKPNGQVAVMGSAEWLHMTTGQKNTTLEDWPTWAASGAVDEVVLEGDWTAPQGRADYAASKAALADINAKLLAASKTKRAPVKLTVLIPLRDANGRALDPLSQMLTLQGQGVKSIMLQVSDASDLPRANEFISQTLPSIESVLQ